MKIACIGNMNNMLFSMCQYLRDNQIDCDLFLFEGEPFLPEHDSYTKDYEKFCFVLPIGKSTLYQKSKRKKVRNILKNYDFFIGTDLAPALFYSIGLKLSIFVPHGSDIYTLPFIDRLPSKKNKKLWWLTDVFFVSQMQLRGVRQVPSIFFPDEYEVNYPFKKSLNTRSKFYNFSVPMLYAPQYKDLDLIAQTEKSENIAFFSQLRAQYDFIVFSHSRQNGSNLPLEMKVHEKGNEQLIRGFAEFISKNQSLNTRLILFEYGMDIEFAKNLIKTLTIEKFVIWVPKMKRKEIIFGILASDVGCGIFANSWLTCGVVNEILVTGTPLIHYRDDALYQKDYTELYPMYNAKTPTEICQALNEVLAAKKNNVLRSRAGIEWIEKFSVNQPVNQALELIKHYKNNRDQGSNSWTVGYFANRTKFELFLAKVFYKLKTVLKKST